MRPAVGSLFSEAAKSAVAAPLFLRRRRGGYCYCVSRPCLPQASGLLSCSRALPPVLIRWPHCNSEAQYIADEIQAANVKLQILDESYLQAQGPGLLVRRQGRGSHGRDRADRERSSTRIVPIFAKWPSRPT